MNEPASGISLVSANDSGPISTPTIILAADLPQPIALDEKWSEVQTSDGRVYYYDSTTGQSQWTKPPELQSSSELSVSATEWKQFKIWDGRSFFHNERTKCSVWSAPPEVMIAQASSPDEVDPQYYACAEFDKSFKSIDSLRSEFHSLLVERGIDEKTAFPEAMAKICDDIRYNCIPDDETRRIFFAAYLSSLMKKRTQADRDSARALCIEAVTEWSKWRGMSESTTFSQMESSFKDRSWYGKLDRLTLIKIFQVFSTEFIEIERLKKRKLQDTLMHELKNDILSRLNEFDLSSIGVVDLIFHTYNSKEDENHKPPQFWSYLSDSQRLNVIKSCIAQRVREVRMSVANQLPLSRDRRSHRQVKDDIKRLIGQIVSGGSADKGVVSRGQSVNVPKWSNEIERAVLAQSFDVRLAKELFNEYAEDVKKGRNPLEGL